MALSVDVYPPAIVPARNPVVFQISADIGSPQKQNHRIGLQVLRREGNLDVLVFEDLVTPWFNGNRAIARFEISELLITQPSATRALRIVLSRIFDAGRNRAWV